MTRPILKLERKSDRNSDINIDFFVNYLGELTVDKNTPGKTIYRIDNGIDTNEPLRQVSIRYQDEVGDKAKVIISSGNFNDEIEINDTDFIVIEDSDVNPPANINYGIEAIVIEDSDVNPPASGKTTAKIILLSSKEDLNIRSAMRSMAVTTG